MFINRLLPAPIALLADKMRYYIQQAIDIDKKQA